MALSLPAAELASTLIASVLYGIYLVTFGITARVLLTTGGSGRWRHRSEINWIVVTVAAVMFVNATLDLSINMNTLVEAFVVYTGPGGAEHVFGHPSNWQNITESYCVFSQSLLGDALLIYRCWYLWSKSWLVIALPMCAWLANLACTILILVLQSQLDEGQVNSGKMVTFGLVFFSLTICMNIFATSFIILRIWRVEKENKKFRLRGDSAHSQPPSVLSRAMRNIVESGMIYTVASIIELAAFSSGSTLNYPASGFVSQEFHSIGITFNLIIIRGVRGAREDATIASTAVRFRSAATINNVTSTGVGLGDKNDTTDNKTDVFVLSALQTNSDSVVSAGAV
ncbi:hypothetical protein B0H17DRAFT_1295195 [Mycena rosella]|uniref:Uncharacterized protein n=1 Tax=Mycena rosella TaxID=1033263 RepID=A0AAD7DE74_MYCRO|nr:hypothetical protein B0H17DRAFT_1295195 [Mycena rosella]